MKKADIVMYQGKRYMVLETKGVYITICNGDYNHYGEDAVTVKRNEVTII